MVKMGPKDRPIKDPLGEGGGPPEGGTKPCFAGDGMGRRKKSDLKKKRLKKVGVAPRRRTRKKKTQKGEEKWRQTVEYKG